MKGVHVTLGSPWKAPRASPLDSASWILCVCEICDKGELVFAFGASVPISILQPPFKLSFKESYHWPKENGALSLPTWRGALASVTEFLVYSRACLVIPGIQTQITMTGWSLFSALAGPLLKGPLRETFRHLHEVSKVRRIHRNHVPL